MAAFEDSDFEKMEEIRARVDSIVEDPDTAAGPEGLVPAAVQAAVLPRRVPAGVQRARRPPRRHRRQGRRAHHRDRRRRRRRRVRGRLHHLRVGLRGRHRVHAPGRLRPDRARRRASLSEYWADGMRTQARHPRARLPEPVHRAAHPGRQPDLERARTTSPRRAKTIAMTIRARARRTATDEVEVTAGGRGRVARAAAHRTRDDARPTPTARPATTTTRASRWPATARCSSATPPAPWRTSSTSTQWRSKGDFEGLEFR